MTSAPEYNIDPYTFGKNPYPDLKRMRSISPLAFVPQLGATLITKHKDIVNNEKKVDIFSSYQPEGLMTKLMGGNLMRKDGDDHMKERKVILSGVFSPAVVKQYWMHHFQKIVDETLTELFPKKNADLVNDYAMPVAAKALQVITGLRNMPYPEIDRVSQGMVAGCANYGGDPDVEKYCNECTRTIDNYIDEILPDILKHPDQSLISIQLKAGFSRSMIQGNIKLMLIGGQNEPRDAIAGTIWALLNNPADLDAIRKGKKTWLQAFEEYCRWIAPIGMSPRRVTKKYVYKGVELHPEDKVFLMYNSANHDEEIFKNPEKFDIERDNGQSLTFGAGPHYCAGVYVSRELISSFALPKIFDKLEGLKITSEILLEGWAFRGVLNLPCKWV